MPFIDASALAITSPTEGRLAKANGLGAHGELALRVLDADGQATMLTPGGSELLPEPALVAELDNRPGAPAVAPQP